MRLNIVFLVLLNCGIVLGPRQAIAQMYTWTNADGTISVTDDPAKIPEQYRKQSTQKGNDDPENRISYSKPRTETSAAASGAGEPESKPKKQMTDEEKKKVEAETRAVWEGMKKALSEKRL